MKPAEGAPEELAARLLDALPQTQCTRCGLPDCAAYAQAIVEGEAGINQCPPGGQSGVTTLAHITGLPSVALDPQFGQEGPRHVVYIDENWCIGCTLCIAVCPTDAIVGSNKRMHTVMERYCTGCDLCLPVCPVDCIVIENATDQATGWDAWSQAQADLARERYNFRVRRTQKQQQQHAITQAALAQTKLANLAEHSRIADPKVLEHKKAVIEAAMARAREKQNSTPNNKP
ncbi:MAG: electron transport complex subunit RsxB [Burkholderiales bacterium]|nr:electron transport complex subunit RsxB [Burkholderiales bacterium]